MIKKIDFLKIIPNLKYSWKNGFGQDEVDSCDNVRIEDGFSDGRVIVRMNEINYKVGIFDKFSLRKEYSQNKGITQTEGLSFSLSRNSDDYLWYFWMLNGEIEEIGLSSSQVQDEIVKMGLSSAQVQDFNHRKNYAFLQAIANELVGEFFITDSITKQNLESLASDTNFNLFTRAKKQKRITCRPHYISIGSH